jgi:uncharacterized protein (TIGR00297 family)
VTTHSENARQWVHIGSAGFALLLRFLTWWQAAALAAVALVFNVLVLPRIGGRRLYRPIDEARGFPLGIVVYPFAVLLLILIFPSRLDIVAAAWAILAFGDGVATLVGRRVPTSPLPWNHEKTVGGTVAFVMVGGAAGVALACWTRPAVNPMPPLWFDIAGPIVAAIVAALVETIPVRLDDNVSVPASAALVLWLISLMSPAALAASRSVVVGTLPWAIGVNVVVAALGHRAGTVSLSGTIVGALIGVTIYTGAGRNAWVLLFVTFAVATIASRLGLERKVLLGIAEERTGRRGAGNALANCGVAAAAAIAVASTPHPTAALLALAAALVAGGSDTVASEIGKAWGRSTFLITSFGRVKPGTPGAMSLEGTTAGVVAAFGLASLAVALGQIAWGMTAAVVVAATVGALVESMLGATLEGPGILNNDLLNFINTAVAAAVALVLA